MSNHPVADRDSAPWWSGLGDHRLLLQTCDRCDVHRLVPRALCSACGSFDWHWSEASGAGTIATWTVSHRAYQPERRAPYVVVLVSLDEHPDILLPGGWTGASDGSDLAVGLEVTAEYQDLERSDRNTPAALLAWRPMREPS